MGISLARPRIPPSGRDCYWRQKLRERSAGKTVFSAGAANWIAVSPGEAAAPAESGRSMRRGPAMRTIARQQFGFVLTAAAFLFVGAVILGVL
jgi:hypothetical protein